MASIDRFDDAFREVIRDGRVTEDELRWLVRLWNPVPQNCGLVHECVVWIDRALHGLGIYGDWFNRQWKESKKHQTQLRLVSSSEDDDPGPSGPAQMKRAA